MSESNKAANRDTAAQYIRENFAPTDRLAVVLLNKRTDSVIQRLAAAEKIAAPDFQDWLRHQNAQRYDVYVSMNALQPAAKGRTKQDVAAIRHVYLDFDENGTAAVDALLKREDVPKPNYVVSSSPDKWQVVWKVEGFAKEQAEDLQKGLVRECGADPAATDCARVLRLPGFYNHKYAKPHLIKAESLASEVYHPEQFPKFSPEDRSARTGSTVAGERSNRKSASGHNSQSERDWAYAKRALARGESPDVIVAAIASYRRYEKHNPQYYAEHTVKKAAESLDAERERVGSADVERS
jgi:hypothetical protein